MPSIRFLDDAYLRCREMLAAAAAPGPSGRPLAAATLEQRLLLSASPIPVMAEATTASDEASIEAAAPADDHVRSDAAAGLRTPLVDSVLAEVAAEFGTANSSDFGRDIEPDAVDAVVARREVVFVDSSVGDLDRLLDDLWQPVDGAERTVVLLTRGDDGVARIGQELAKVGAVDAVHVFSHATDGALKLGGEWITAETLRGRATDVAAWGAHLSGGADLLLYGCDLAASAEGQRLLDTLASLSGADLAASTDATGAAALGGDWVLEHRIGQVESRVALSEPGQRSYRDLLDTFVVTSTADSGSGTLRQAILDANALPGQDTISFQLPIGRADIVPGYAGVTTYTINLASDLPDITGELLIDASTQDPMATEPVIILAGDGTGDGLTFAASASGLNRVEGIAFTQFARGVVSSATGLNIIGNWFGLQADGVSDGAIPIGVDLLATNGGTVVEGNRFATTSIGVRAANATNGSIRGNVFGLAADDATRVGDGTGVELGVGSTGVGVGSSSQPNEFHGIDTGVFLTSDAGVGNTIQSNLYFAIGTEAIVFEGGQPNDAGDVDAGPNGNLNRMLITQVDSDGSTVSIDATIDGAADVRYRARFFAFDPDTAGPSDEAHLEVGTLDVTADAFGQRSFGATFAASLPANYRVTGVLQDLDTGDTSPLSVSQSLAAVNGDEAVAVADRYTVDTAGQPLFVVPLDAGVLANDRSFTTLTASLISGPDRAAEFTFNSDGTFSFRPEANEAASSLTFVYQVDNGVDQSQATVTLDLQPATAGGETDFADQILASSHAAGLTASSSQAIAAMPDGGVVIVGSHDLAEGGGEDIFIMRLAADGSVLWSHETLNTNRVGDQQNASVAVSADGVIAVVWESDSDDAGGRAVLYALLDADGATASAPKRLHPTSNGDEYDADVTALSDGRFAVDYLSDPLNSTDTSTNSYLLAADGTITNGPQTIDTPGDVIDTATAARLDGGFAGTLIDSGNLYYGYFTAGLTLAPGTQVVATETGQPFLKTDLVVDATGQATIVWLEGGDTIRMRRYDASGTALGASETIATGPSLFDPKLTVGDDGIVILVFGRAELAGAAAADDIRMLRIAADGRIAGAESVVPRLSTGRQGDASAAAIGNGEVVVVYSGDREATRRGVFRQVVGPVLTYSISGTVYEDADATGAALDSGSDVIAGTVVRLWQDDGDGVADADDLFAAQTTTLADGSYEFGGLDLGDYFVTFDSRTVTPTTGFELGSGLADVWAVQTAHAAQTARVFVGDDDATALETSDWATAVAISGADVSGVDAGFSFAAVTTTADAGRSQGTLRQSLANADAIAGADAVLLRLDASDAGYDAAAGVWTITWDAATDVVGSTVTIDGRTQAGYVDRPVVAIDAGGFDYGLNVQGFGSSVRGLAIGNAGVAGLFVGGDAATIDGNFVGVRADGSTPSANAIGIQLTASDGTTISGNVVSGNASTGIRVDGSENLTLVGNRVGLTSDGLASLGNDGDGVWISDHAGGLAIGGPSVGNVFSGNAGDGLRLENLLLSETATVAENLFGLSVDGQAAAGNQAAGLSVNGVANLSADPTTVLQIGEVGSGNTFAANGGTGLSLIDAEAVVVEANTFGTSLDGSQDRTNAAGAIEVVGASRDILIGGQISDAGNQIGGTHPIGVAVVGVGVDDPAGVRILGNSIGSQNAVGIELRNADGTGDGRLDPDAGDLDTGANGQQNHPTLSAASSDFDGTEISGTLLGVAGRSYRLEFFTTPVAGADNAGPAETLVHVETIIVGADGVAAFTTARFDRVTPGWFVTATATDLVANQTSELATNIVATAVNIPATAAPDSYTTTADPTLVVDAASGVLENDSDPDAAPETLTAELIEGPAHAREFAFAADGSFSYRRDANYVGDDAFTYRVFDGQDYSNAVTVTLAIDPTFFGATIAGDIVEDADSDGSIDSLGDASLAGVTVRLYDDDGDGLVGVGDELIAETQTDADGRYSFGGLANGTYAVVADSRTIVPNAGLNDGSGPGSVWAVQTYSAGANASIAAGSDDASSLLTAAHVQQVVVADAGAAVVDFGFSFTAITTTRSGDDVPGSARSVQGSLDQFLRNANAIVGEQTSHFRLDTADAGYDATTGIWTITPDRNLPGIVDAVELDARLQAGYLDRPLVRIEAAAITSSAVFRAVDATTTIAGFNIDDASVRGIRLQGGAGHVVAANWIGLRSDGSLGHTRQTAVRVLDADVTIGGEDAADGNRIGAAGRGIRVSGGSATIANNIVGVGPADGAEQIGIFNAAIGIESGDAASFADIRDNQVLVGGGRFAISLTNGSGDVLIRGNTIGTLADGSEAAANSSGILSRQTGGRVVVGGTDDAHGNTFASNLTTAIETDDPASELVVVGNVFRGDAAASLHLVESGRPGADRPDWTNRPVLSLVESRGGSTRVEGSVSSLPSTLLRVEIYAAGESVAVANVATDASGLAEFAVDALSLPVGTPVVVSTTVVDGRTHEFSDPFAVQTAPPRLMLGSPSATYVENALPVSLAPAATVIDYDSDTLQSLVVSLRNPRLGDRLLVDAPVGTTASYDAATGRLTVTGEAATDAYIAAIRSVAFLSEGENPSIQSRTAEFVVDDGTGRGASVSMGIEVVSENDAPVGSDSEWTVAEDAELVLDGLLAVAFDAEGDTLSLDLVDGPANGSLTAIAGGWTYRPTADFAGPDSFRYQVSDGNAVSGEIEVGLVVIPVNDEPFAGSADVTLSDDYVVAVDGLLGIASDTENDALTLELVAGPSHGTLVEIDGGWRYTADLAFNGVDEFLYRVFDGVAYSEAALVTLDVSQVLAGPAPVPATSGSGGGPGSSLGGGPSGGFAPPLGGGQPAADPLLDPPPPVRGGTESPTPATTSASVTPSANSSSASASSGGGAGVDGGAGDGGVAAGPTRATKSAIEFAEGVAHAVDAAFAEGAAGVAMLSFGTADASKGDPQRPAEIALARGGELRPLVASVSEGVAWINGRAVAFEEAFLPQFFRSQPGYLEELDEGRRRLQSTLGDGQIVAGSAVVTGTACTIGYAVWTVRGGYLMASVLTAMPTWRMIDPLPVLRDFSAGSGTSDSDDDAGHTLGAMLSSEANVA